MAFIQAGHRRSIRAAAVVTTAALLAAGCSSSAPGGGASSKASSPSAAIAMLRQRLAALEKPLGPDEAQRAFEGLSVAMTGISEDSLSIELVNWQLQQLSTPEGRKTYLANNSALNGHILPAGGTSAPSAPTLGAAATPGRGRAEQPAAYHDTPNAGAGLSFYFVNGVLNDAVSAGEGKGLLESSLTQMLGFPVNVNLIFNASGADIAWYTYNVCQHAQAVTANHPIPETEQLVKAVCVISAAGAVALPQRMIADVGKLFLQKTLDPNFASDPVNAMLLDPVTHDLQSGKRVVLISHSEGGLYLRNALSRIGAGAPVGAVFIAPPFGTGQELNANPTRYVMFNWDWLLMDTGVPGGQISHVDPTVEAAAPQVVYDGSVKSRFDIHYLANYLYCGSASAKQIGDRTREVVDYVNSVPASRGAARPQLPGASGAAALHGDGLLPQQTEVCPVPQPSSETPTTQTPSETPATPTESPSTSSETPATPTESPSTSSETPATPTPSAAYYVFVLTNVSGGNIFVGTLQDVQGARTCDFVDGGLCAPAGGQDVPVQYTVGLGPYPTLVDAQAAYCANAADPHTGPGGAGTKVDIFGGSYWADNINFTCPVTPSP
ncbi:hypothetical protein [Kitasatospora sp. NPDC087314]|uniref:hypothetical protein n=1 Tax=Kitasatospora sp. NPDC087314 TaxID=3364068 RepID=UPI0037FC50C8